MCCRNPRSAETTAEDFLREQLGDVSLRKCFVSADVTKGKPVSEQTCHFIVQKGLLYLIYRKEKGSEVVSSSGLQLAEDNRRCPQILPVL